MVKADFKQFKFVLLITVVTVALATSVSLFSIPTVDQLTASLITGAENSLNNASSAALINANDNAAFKRVLLHPSSGNAGKASKKLGLDNRHEFPDGSISFHVNAKGRSKLAKLGTLEEVPVYQILARACYPASQIEYNVSQVGGGSGGVGVNVAVLDTGVDIDHLDLVGNISICKDATKRKISNGCEDRDGHGTHVAGIIAANGGSDSQGLIGVAPQAGLHIIKVCGKNGCFTDDIAAAIDYAGGNGSHIVNMSLGGDSQSGLIRDAITRNPHLLYIAAAGNDGPVVGSIDWPGADSRVIAVAANDSNKVVASFSSRGIDDGNDAVISDREVELTAGGVAVNSTSSNGCYSPMSGTSFSSPTIAGLAAKVWQGTASNTRAHLRSLALDINNGISDNTGTGYDVSSGYGLPGAVCTPSAEVCDGVDNNCDGVIDEGFDLDGDGYSSCAGDCNDNDAGINPGAEDVCENGVDEDCSGSDEACNTSICGDGVCAGIEYGEDCFSCPSDCRGKGKNNSKACCGDEICRGENSRSCAVDCS